MSTISAGTTSTTTLIHSGDTTGSLVFKTNDTGSGGTTAMTIDTSQNVGIGTTSPTRKLEVNGQIMGTDLLASNSSVYCLVSGTTYGQITASVGALNIDAKNNSNLTFQVASSEKMRIDSSGNVGIGTSSPTAFGAGYVSLTLSGSNAGVFQSKNTLGDTRLYANTSGEALVGSWANTALKLYTNSTLQATLDASGNLGLGVTPSAWGGGWKALDIAGSGAVSGTTVLDATSNAYFNGTNWIYKSNDLATRYRQYQGTYAWFNAPSGTAGNAITFTQAMTLDASGNLLVNTTDAGMTTGNGIKLTPAGDGSTYPRIGVVTAATTNGQSVNYSLYSTGASAYRFYVGAGGTISATSATITSLSDQRLKENIRDLDEGLNSIMALKPRKFDWKEGKGADIKNARGFIAQEFETVFPDMIEHWIDPAPEGEEPYKGVNANLIPTLVKAIQELKAELDIAKAEIAALKGATP